MIGLVLVTHGRLATEFRVAMEHVVGPQDAIETVCIGPDDDMEARRADISAAVARVNDGSGVILLTDLFGGTPSNLAISLLDAGKVEVIAGINLPMLIRLESARRTMSVTKAVAAAREAGTKYISVASANSMLSKTVRISNKRGLHARASAKFVTLATGLDATIMVRKDAHEVIGTSIMGLMMLGAAMGDEITITSSGNDAEAALAAVTALVEDRFGEE